MRKAVFIVIFMFSAVTAATFTKVIGNTSSFSVKIIVDDEDTTHKEFDSLCSRYEFLPFYKRHWSNCDLKFQIFKKANIPGNLTVSINDQYYLNQDTLQCNSLNFKNELIADTIKSDSVSFCWDYPWPTKRTALPNFSYLYFTDYVKFKIKSNSINDSMVFTREHLYVQGVKYGTHGSVLDKQKLSVSNKEPQFFDLCGKKLNKLKKQSIVIEKDKSRSAINLFFVQ